MARAFARLRDRGPAIVASAVGTFAVLATAVAVAVSQPPSTGHTAAVSPTGLSSVAPGDELEIAPKPDLRPFRQAARKPAAAAPIRKLPKVQIETVSVTGIPPVPLQAYRSAAQHLATTSPGCHLPWWLVAGIGFVESGHAHSGGSLHVGWNGVATPPILGPVLDGSQGFMAIPDTDNGVYDGDRKWDRAIGPMQFLPSTWLRWGPPGHLDGHASAQNIRAAALATASYLCASGSDVSQPKPMALAVFSYNHSFDYVRLVLSVGARYAGLSPDALGVDLLPTDHQVRKHHKAKHHKARQHQKHAKADAKQRDVKDDAAPNAGSNDASPSAKPTPSSAPSPSKAPSPTSAPTPLPTVLPTLGIHGPG